MAAGKQLDKPQRSCLGCRESRDRDQLIRFVMSPAGELTPDIEGKLPGRGAYTCISSACLAAAVKQRQFNRAFKAEIAALQPGEAVEMVASLLRKRILGYLGLANKAGQLISGGSLVSDAVRSSRKPGVILVASDISGAIGEKIEQLAHVHNVACLKVMTKDDFGAIVGKAPRSAMAVKAGGFPARLIQEITRYRNFLGEVQNI